MSTSEPENRSQPIGMSKLCIWTSNSFTTPEMPSRLPLPPMPLRAPPMASNSSMNPMAPALGAGGLAQRLEVRADLLVGLPVVHRLEGAGGHEEERHAGLGRHGLREVRLARAGMSLEQHTPRRGCRPLVGDVRWARNRLSVSIASRLVESAPTTSSRRMGESVGRSVTCGERPAASSGTRSGTSAARA